MNPFAAPFYPSCDDDEPGPICPIDISKSPPIEIDEPIIACEVKKIDDKRSYHTSKVKSKLHSKQLLIENFREIAERFYQRIMDEASKVIEHAKETTHTYAILNPDVISEHEGGYSSTTMIYGFCDTAHHAYNTKMFTANKIEMPFYRAVKELNTYGYSLTNVSDVTKSHKIFLKLSW